MEALIIVIVVIIVSAFIHLIVLNNKKSNKIENQIVGKDQKKELTKSNEEIINTLECFCQEIKQNQTGNNEFQILIDELTKLIHFFLDIIMKLLI